MRETVDGIPWDIFRDRNNNDTTYAIGLEKLENTISFRTPDNSRVTLYKDGTWGMDCAPDWNGAS